MAKVLLIGSGGREHALAASLASSAKVETVFVSPGNAGTLLLPKGKNLPLNIKNHEKITDFCLEEEIGLVVIGPEDPLADGLTDSLQKANVKVFGPSKAAAQIETSKSWAKSFMKRNSIPTADFEVFESLEDAQHFIDNSSWEGFVVKVSGLAGGKGVIVADDKEIAKLALQDFRFNKSSKIIEASKQIVVEEKLSGFEISVIALSDGSNIQVLPPAQDHKQRFAGGMGKNTGGMGAYCPCPLVSKQDLDFIENFILQKTVDHMRSEGCTYAGALYAGIMVTREGPKVLEFNCRFGDPETQALVPLLKIDLFSAMMACAEGNLKKCSSVYQEEKYSSAVSVVIRSYPDDVEMGLRLEIKGIDTATERENCFVYFAGTSYDKESESYRTSGGRVMSICSVSPSLHEAVTSALRGAGHISFKDAPDGFEADFRGDIGFQSVKKLNENDNRKLTYSSVGVSVAEGSRFVSSIKELCLQTKRPGVRGDLGMFGAVFDTRLEGYNNPLLVSGTDGVGTKLKIAIDSGTHDSIGEDLVAMCVNDVLVHGAEPLFFLDYLASGKLNTDVHREIVKGISKGCILANCSLVGGETAEMPGMYGNGDYDVAGFVVGAVEEDKILPKLDQMRPGNILIGVASSGLHSNGFTLLRKVLETLQLNSRDPSPFNPDEYLYKELLRPTYIYTPLLNLLQSGLVLGAAHVTGGGIEENILRVVPSHLSVKIETSWQIPSIFAWLAALGIGNKELLHTFNLGIGLIIIAERKDEQQLLNLIEDSLSKSKAFEQRATYSSPKDGGSAAPFAWVIGSLQENKGNSLFEIRQLDEALLRTGCWLVERVPKCIPFAPRVRTAVLISGSGTNLQALLDHTLSGLSRAEIVLVISNVAGVQGLQRAAAANVASKVIPHQNYSSRNEFENEIDKVLTFYKIDIVCLAGFMRILTRTFVRKWENRMINIHPSLLPSFKGNNAQKQALEYGVYITGCTVHFVTEEVDAGLIIAQEAVSIHKKDTVKSLTETIKKAEHRIYPRALEMVAREYLQKYNE